MFDIRSLKPKPVRAFVLFGFLDSLTLTSYLFFAISKGRIPFYSDWITVKSAIEQWEMSFVYIFPIAQTLVYLSLFFSIYYFWSLNSKVKWWVLGQTPLRILGLTPTIPFLLTGLARSMSHTPTTLVVIYLIVATLEIAKTVYLFRRS